MKTSRWLLMLAAVALVAAACGDDGGDDAGPTDQDCTWTIGTMGALSGDAASIGEPIFQGIEYGVNEVNDSGDLACELALVSEDSQGNPEQAPALAQSLVEEETLVAINGPYFSGETLATGELFNEAGIPFITPSATNETIDDQGWDNFFRAVPNDGDQGPVAAEYIRVALEAQKVAVVHDNQDYSKGLADTVLEELEDIAEGPFTISPEEPDYSAVVAQVKDVNPDVVYYGGYSPQAGPLAKQLKEAGVDAQFFSDDGTNASDFGELAGEAAEGAQLTTPAKDPLKVDAASSFVEGINGAYNRDPGTFAAEAYDIVNLIAEALKGVDGAADIQEVRDTIRTYLDDVEGFEGISKSYTFGDNGEVEIDPLQDVWIYEWQTDAFVSLGPAADFVQ